MKSPIGETAKWKIGDSFTLKVGRASKLHATFYVMGGQSDRESGGWLLEELEKNLRICIAEKTGKISAVRTNYPEWWLVFADPSATALTTLSRANKSHGPPEFERIWHSAEEVESCGVSKCHLSVAQPTYNIAVPGDAWMHQLANGSSIIRQNRLPSAINPECVTRGVLGK